jgi:hypothetical protein
VAPVSGLSPTSSASNHWVTQSEEPPPPFKFPAISLEKAASLSAKLDDDSQSTPPAISSLPSSSSSDVSAGMSSQVSQQQRSKRMQAEAFLESSDYEPSANQLSTIGLPEKIVQVHNNFF